MYQQAKSLKEKSGTGKGKSQACTGLRDLKVFGTALQRLDEADMGGDQRAAESEEEEEGSDGGRHDRDRARSSANGAASVLSETSAPETSRACPDKSDDTLTPITNRGRQ